MTTRELLARLEKVKPANGGWLASCPAHEDSTPSLSIKEKDQKLLIHCFAGCSVEDILSSLSMSTADLFSDPTIPVGRGLGRESAAYDYTDESGKVIFQSVRFEPKAFRQRHLENDKWVWGLNGQRRVIYNLPEVIKAETVYIVEGEKDCDTLGKLGLVATTNPMGAGKWRTEYNQYFRGKNAIIIQDNDDPGIKHAQQVATELHGIAAEVVLLHLPEGKDVSEYFARGNSLDDLIGLLERSELWTPIPEKEPDAPAKLGITFRELKALQLDESPPMVTGLYRGQVGMVLAATNDGKTTFIRNGAICVASGRPFKPFYAGGKPLKVALLDNEDGLGLIRADVATMASQLSPAEKERLEENLIFICDQTIGDNEIRLNNPTHLHAVVQACLNYKIDLIVIETISQAFTVRNENDNSEVISQVMNPMKWLAKLSNTAVLASHHMGKAKQEEGAARSPAHRGRGGSAYADQSKLIWTIDRDHINEKTVLACAKIKGPRPTRVAMTLDEGTRWFTVEEEIRLRSSYETVMSIFDSGAEFTTAELLEILKSQISTRSVKANLAQALKCNDLEKVKHGVYRKACVLQLENESAKVQTV